jgi:hypothetical protein
MPDTLRSDLPRFLPKLLAGEEVDIGLYVVRENFIYQHKRDASGGPLLRRVLELVYFDEDWWDKPAREDFDGTLESLEAALDAHDAFEYDDEEEVS